MKKKILIAMGVLAGVVLILMTTIVMIAYIMVQQGYGITVGRYLESSGGAMLIENNSPITMSPEKNSNQKMFDGLTTGDKIVVVHGMIMETYPAQTYVKYCLKQEDGDWSDISMSLLQDLVSMGWVKEEDVIRYRAETCDFEAQYIRTDGGAENIYYPMVTVISSVEELNAYYEQYKGQYDLERRDTVYSDSTIGFLDASDKYDEAYFENQQLVLIMLEAYSGSIRYVVKSVGVVEEKGEEKLVISIQTQMPEIETCDMAQWTCFVELEKGVSVENADNVIILSNLEALW